MSIVNNEKVVKFLIIIIIQNFTVNEKNIIGKKFYILYIYRGYYNFLKI